MNDDPIVVLTNNSCQVPIVFLEYMEGTKLTADYVINRLVNEDDQKKGGNTECLPFSASNTERNLPRLQVT